jgi:predicted enzyme related to lactoylglutathione lyase
MADLTVRGRFVWHELWTPNRAGAHDFYEQAVGWQRQPSNPDESYSMFIGPQGPLGAAVENRTATPQWLAYIATTDVDATVEAATRLGARVLTPPTSLPNAGRYAVLIDPQGATFGVHASNTAPLAESELKLGDFSWHELATNVAPEAAFAFYAELFGWDEQSRFDMGPMGTYLIFGRGGTQLGGMFDKGAQGRSGGAYWLGYVQVDDVDAATERAKALRASVLAAPMDVPGGDRVAQLMDPHGAFFALHARRAGAAAPEQAQRKPAKKTAARRPAKSAQRKPPAKAPAKKAAKKKARKKAKAARPRKAAKKKRMRATKRAAPRKKRAKATAKKKRR